MFPLLGLSPRQTALENPPVQHFEASGHWHLTSHVLADAIMKMFRLPDVNTSSAALIQQENGIHDVASGTHDVESSILQSLGIHASLKRLPFLTEI